MLTSLLVTTACFAACDNCLKTLWEIIQSVSQRIQYSLKVSQDTFEWFIHPSRTIPIPLFQSLTPTPHWSQTIPAYTKPSQNIPNYPEPFSPILNHPYLSWSIPIYPWLSPPEQSPTILNHPHLSQTIPTPPSRSPIPTYPELSPLILKHLKISQTIPNHPYPSWSIPTQSVAPLIPPGSDVLCDLYTAENYYNLLSCFR